MPETSTKVSLDHIGTVLMVVTDQDRAIDFYTGTLGFEKRADTPYGDGQRWVEVAPAGQTTGIALVPPMGGAEPGGCHVAFASHDVEGDHAALKAAGVDVDDIMPGGDPVPAMFFFRDPDGNALLAVKRDG